MLSAPTQRPGEPLTAGLDSGPGPGSDVLGLQNPSQQVTGDMQTLKQHLPLLRDAAAFVNAPQSFKRLVNYLEQS
jgi:hypothetical protein